jgi:hypothetical protein
MNIEMTMLGIYGDYSMWCLADAMLICLNSENPEEYNWALDSLKKLGELRKSQKDEGYLDQHYKDVIELLDMIKVKK